MKKWVLAIVIVAVCVGLYVLLRQHRRASSEGIGSRPGQRAPDFSVRDLNGRPLRLTHYRGKVVLLNFWATWCEPCRHEIPQFIELQKNNPSLQVLGISLDDSDEPVRTFYTDFKINYPIAVGDAALARQYGGILGLPVTFIIDCDGRIFTKHIGEVNVAEVANEINPLRNGPACHSESR